jgi:hypothetical protein
MGDACVVEILVLSTSSKVAQMFKCNLPFLRTTAPPLLRASLHLLCLECELGIVRVIIGLQSDLPPYSLSN